MGADRIELITWVERRRRWSVDDKLGLVAETREGGNSVASVAKANGISPSLLYSVSVAVLARVVYRPLLEAAFFEFLPAAAWTRVVASDVPEGIGDGG